MVAVVINGDVGSIVGVRELRRRGQATHFVGPHGSDPRARSHPFRFDLGIFELLLLLMLPPLPSALLFLLLLIDVIPTDHHSR